MPFIPDKPKIRAFHAFDATNMRIPPGQWWRCCSNGRSGIGRTIEVAYNAWKREIEYAVLSNVACRWGSYARRSATGNNI